MFRSILPNVRNTSYRSDMADIELNMDLRARLLDRIASDPEEVWTPSDFVAVFGAGVLDRAQRTMPSWEMTSKAHFSA